MRSAGLGGNPFRPGTGSPPPRLAGRDRELDFARRLLSQLASGDTPSQGMLVLGPRGNGKTAILGRIARMAEEVDLRAERFPVDVLRRRDLLTAELQEYAGLGGRQITGVSVGPIGASTQPAVPSGNLSRLLASWVTVTAAPLVILLDEAQRIETGTGGAFFEAVQHATMDRLPFLLVTSGTPDVARVLRRCGTFLERAFVRFRIGRLSKEAAREALEVPARESGRPMAAGVASLLADEAQRYPYFLQLLGSAAWDQAAARGHSGIGLADARNGLEAAKPALASFYGDRFAEAWERGVHRALLPLAGAVRGKRTLSDHELDDVIETIRRDGLTESGAGRLTAVLQDLGVLWETSPGRWELGIPSFGRYVRERLAGPGSLPIPRR